jgi:hypothetical protein
MRGDQVGGSEEGRREWACNWLLRELGCRQDALNDVPELNPGNIFFLGYGRVESVIILYNTPIITIT